MATETDNDPLHQGLLAFTDKVMAKLVEIEGEVQTLKTQLATILRGHEGDERDALKTRIDNLERKLHPHLENLRKLHPEVAKLEK
jgi:hypothetical protein